MDLFTGSSVLVAFIVFVLTILAQIIYNSFNEEEPDQPSDSNKVFKKKKIQRNFKNFLVALLIGVTGFVSAKILENYNNIISLEKLNKNILFTNNYSKAIERILNLKPKSTFRKYLEYENLNLQDKFNQISNYEIRLKREDVIPSWEFLIENSVNQIYATNVVSINEWEKFSPSAGRKAHEKAFNKGVKVRRIFIYNGSDSIGKKKLYNIAKEQAGWSKNISVGLLNGRWFEESPFVSGYLRDLGTQDIVIYDNECVLLTNTDNNGRIISAVLTTNKHTLDVATRLYNKLWEAAEKIEN